MKFWLILPFSVSVLFGHTPVFALQSGVERDFVVREVFLPRTGVWESAWNPPLFLSEPGNKKCTALFTNETLRGPGHLGGTPLAPSKLLTNSSRKLSKGFDVFSVLAWGSGPNSPRCALLGSPGGIAAVAMDFAQAPDLRVWDLESGTFLRWISHPPPPPGKPALSGFSYIQNASDINGNGWEDLFFQDWTLSGEGVAGCLDGLTGQPLWMEYTADLDTTSRVLPLQPGPPEDINGDGIGDFLSAVNTYSSMQLGYRIIAYSGIDGTILWQRDLIRSHLERETIFCQDLDGDQIDDLISLDGASSNSSHNGEIQAISGATGASIWSRDVTFMQTLFPNATWWGVGGQVITNPSPSGSGVDLILQSTIIQTGNWWDEVAFPVLNAKTGNPITTLEITGTLSPWHSHIVPEAMYYLNQAGDYDGDGFQEFGNAVYLEGDDSNSTSVLPHALVIFGQRTLFGPEQPKIGTAEDFSIALPAHPNAPYQLTFSTGFSPRTDRKMWSPQDWPTMLQWTGVAQKTSAMRSLRGSLDANGQTTFSVNFPNNSNYIGIPFYARALIGDSTNPGEIITQTSLHTLTLQP
jgi:hypothetical protein